VQTYIIYTFFIRPNDSTIMFADDTKLETIVSDEFSAVKLQTCLTIHIHCVPKKLWSRTLAITLSNLNRFQKLLHCCNEKEISNKPYVLIPTTP